MDILKDLADSDLPQLIAIYENHLNWAPYAFTFLKTAQRLRKSPKYRECIKVMSPGDSWKEDGTFIALMEFSSYDLFMCTLDTNCTKLRQGLLETNRIDFTRDVLIFCLHNDFFPHVDECIRQKNLKVELDDLAITFVKSVEEAKHLEIECPPDVYMKKLDLSNAPQISTKWPAKSFVPNAEKYISALIEMNGGYGIFLRSTHELVSWIVVHCLGHLGILQTEDYHKNKGYGTLVTKMLTKKLAEEDGFVPIASVLVSNEPSIGMFEKLGFERIGLSRYCKLVRQ